LGNSLWTNLTAELIK